MNYNDLPNGDLCIVELGKGNRARYDYEKAFAENIMQFRGLPGYAFLHKWAQSRIDLHCGDSLEGIEARMDMDSVNEYPLGAAGLSRWAHCYIAACLCRDDYPTVERDSNDTLLSPWEIYSGTKDNGELIITFQPGTTKEEIGRWFHRTFEVTRDYFALFTERLK